MVKEIRMQISETFFSNEFWDFLVTDPGLEPLSFPAPVTLPLVIYRCLPFLEEREGPMQEEGEKKARYKNCVFFFFFKRMLLSGIMESLPRFAVRSSPQVRCFPFCFWDLRVNLAHSFWFFANGGDGFSTCVLRIRAFCFGAPVALELCPVSSAFWQSSKTWSASGNRYFCSTNEPRFIDSEFKEIRWEITNQSILQWGKEHHRTG